MLRKYWFGIKDCYTALITDQWTQIVDDDDMEEYLDSIDVPDYHKIDYEILEEYENGFTASIN